MSRAKAAKADAVLLSVTRSKRRRAGASADGGTRPDAHADGAPDGGKTPRPARRRV